MKVFRYQIKIKLLLCKYRGNGDNEFGPVYFNSAAKTTTNFEHICLINHSKKSNIE